MDCPAPPNLLFSLFILSTLIVCSTGVTSPVIRTGGTPGQVITVPSGVPVTTSAPPPPAPVSPAIPNYPPPPAVGPPPSTGQGSWCVVKPGAATASVQEALDYACGAGADCVPIQPGRQCFSPSSSQNSLQVHATYAFSSYCQLHKGATCDFGGVAVLTNVNPSSGGCNFPSLTTSSSPTTPTPTPPMTPTTPTPPLTPTPPMNPTTPTPPMNPTTPTPPSPFGGLATPPNTFSPPLVGGGGGGGGGGDPNFGSPQPSSTNSISMLSSLQQSNVVISCVILVTSIATGVIGFEM